MHTEKNIFIRLTLPPHCHSVNFGFRAIVKRSKLRQKNESSKSGVENTTCCHLTKWKMYCVCAELKGYQF